MARQQLGAAPAGSNDAVRLGDVIAKSIGTAKGDQIGFTGSGAPVRHAIGADGTVQTADSSQADGWKWAAAAAGGAAIYGDGSDGTVTFDGTTTVLGMAPSGNAYTLTRDLYLAAGTINSGVTIKAANYRVFCQGALVNNGTISNSGNNANGQSGGAAVAGAIFGGNLAGGTGNGGAGSAGGGRLNCPGGPAGAGGAGNGVAGGAAGSYAVVIASVGMPRTVVNSVFGAGAPGGASSQYVASPSGGGGGGDATNGGGGGGAGGGGLAVAAKTITGTGAIQARGGNGGNGAVASSLGCGGGGGGGGGFVIVVSSSVSGGAIAGQTIDANGGAAGAGHGGNGTTTGVAGSAGTNGLVVLLPN